MDNQQLIMENGKQSYPLRQLYFYEGEILLEKCHPEEIEIEIQYTVQFFACVRRADYMDLSYNILFF